MKLRRFPSRFKEGVLGAIATIDFFGTLIVMLVVLYKAVLEPLSPLITFVLFTGVTVWACKGHDRLNKVLIFSGISFYLLSWKAAVMWGSWGALGVLMLAIGFYFGAIFRAINRNHPAPSRTFAQPLHNH